MPATTLVIPCFEEHERLPRFLPQLLDELSQGGFVGEVLIVDDGSSAASAKLLRIFLEQERKRHPKLLRPLLRFEQNQGKGASIRHGWMEASAQSQWLGFVDADGSASAQEVLRSYRDLDSLSAQEICALFAQRGIGSSPELERFLWRHLAGALFSLMVRLRHQTRLRDSQCGLKWISRAAWDCFGEELQQTGFRFDLELTKYLQFHQGKIHSLPIRWIEASGSKITPLRALQIFCRALLFPLPVNKSRNSGKSMASESQAPKEIQSARHQNR